MVDMYVVGGQQRHARTFRERERYWYKYDKGLVLRVNPETNSVEPCTEYVSPPDVCVEDEPAILFKYASLHDGILYACTQTEVLAYTVPDFQLVNYLSLPCFNDVHHARPTPDGNLLVVISGLDMIIEVTWDGEVLREWNALGGDPWENFSKDIDYRLVASTKPHPSHPNHVFYVGDDIWITRFEQRDAVSLTSPDKGVHIGIERVHDGVVQDGYIYFTTVNAYVFIVNAETLVIEEVIDLNEISQQNVHLGWCRGIMLDDGKAWVGFSGLRVTKFKENLAWVRQGFKHGQPTHLSCYDLKSKRCLTEIDLQSHGLDAVFSILPVPDSIAPAANKGGIQQAFVPR